MPDDCGPSKGDGMALDINTGYNATFKAFTDFAQQHIAERGGKAIAPFREYPSISFGLKREILTDYQLSQSIDA